MREASASIARVRIGLGTSRLPAPMSGVGVEEVAEQLHAAVGEHGLRVELHTLSRQLGDGAAPITHAVAASGLFKAVGQMAIDHERVIAPDGERGCEVAEDRAPVVLDRWSSLP